MAQFNEEFTPMNTLPENRYCSSCCPVHFCYEWRNGKVLHWEAKNHRVAAADNEHLPKLFHRSAHPHSYHGRCLRTTPTHCRAYHIAQKRWGNTCLLGLCDQCCYCSSPYLVLFHHQNRTLLLPPHGRHIPIPLRWGADSYARLLETVSHKIPLPHK